MCNNSSHQQRYSPCGISLNWQKQNQCLLIIECNQQKEPNTISDLSFCQNKHFNSKKRRGDLELTIGATGLKQKQKQKKYKRDHQEKQVEDAAQEKESQQVEIQKRFSRLSRFSLLQSAIRCLKMGESERCSNTDNLKYSSYQQFKRQGVPISVLVTMDMLFQGRTKVYDSLFGKEEYKNEKEYETSIGPLVGWINSSHSGDFVIQK